MACQHGPGVICTTCPVGRVTIYPTTTPVPTPTYPTLPATFVTAPVTTPHRCPVCEGRGKVAENFYSDDPPFPSYDKTGCRSCWGSGVLWR